MICRLCLKSAAETINLFDDIGTELNMASVLTKHFWFQPKIDDPISTAICSSCWSKVNEFHEFYLLVEEAHRLLTERFFIRAETKCKIKQQTNATDINDVTTRTFYESDKIIARENQVLFNELCVENTSDGPIDEALTEAHRNEAELNSDASSTYDADGSVFDNEQLIQNVFVTTDMEDKFSENALTFAEEQQIDSLEIPKQCTEKRRSTRVATRNMINKVATKKELQTKRRGRPPKSKIKTNNEKETSKGTTKKISAYNNKMHKIDEMISKHMKLLCDICHIEQETYLKLCKHMLQVHRRRGYAICCNKKFFKRSFLTDHIEHHNNPDKFKCDLCGKCFVDKQCLRNHELLKHQPDEVKTFQCPNCPKKFAKKYLLDQHRVMHEERTLPCDVCNRRFHNISLLSTHIKTVHSNYGTHMCDICAKVIRGRTLFAQHQLEHAGVVAPKAQCNICGSWYKNEYSLKKHIRRHNSTNEPHVCNICGKASPTRNAMLSHQRYVHKSERKYECTVCCKAFKTQLILKEHMAIHTGEVLYNCPYCSKTFNSNANMHSHRKKVHPKEFAEARKARALKRNPVTKEQQNVGTENNANSDGDNSEDKNLASEVITIEDSDNGETHKIILTTGNCQNDDDIKVEGKSIILTLN